MNDDFSNRRALKKAFNEFGCELSGQFNELCNVELEYGVNRAGIPTEELLRCLRKFAKQLKTHLYFTIAGGISDDAKSKPHHHLIVLCKPQDKHKIFLGLRNKPFVTALRYWLKKSHISIAHKTDSASLSLSPRNITNKQSYTEALKYKLHYLSEHEAFLPLEVACPMRSGSCRREIKRSGRCKHHLTGAV